MEMTRIIAQWSRIVRSKSTFNSASTDTDLVNDNPNLDHLTEDNSRREGQDISHKLNYDRVTGP